MLLLCIEENGLLIGYAKTKSKTKWEEAYLAPRLRRGSHLLLVLFHTVTSQLTNTQKQSYLQQRPAMAAAENAKGMTGVITLP